MQSSFFEKAGAMSCNCGHRSNNRVNATVRPVTPLVAPVRPERAFAKGTE
jgi:hypothetical protein